MRRPALMQTLVVSALLLSCSGGTERSGVNGSLSYSGGPSPGVTTDLEAGEVVVYTQAGEEVGRASVERGERFSIPLDPGTYKLTATSGGAPCSEQMFTVEAAAFADVRVQCIVE